MRFFLQIILLISVIIISVITTKMTDIPNISIDKTINPLHAISIFTTILIAVSLSIFFEPQKKRNGSEKEIKIKKLETVINSILSFQSQVNDGEISSPNATSFSKKTNSSLDYLMKSLSTKVTDVKYSEIESITKEITSLLTTTPVEESNSDDIAIRAEGGKYFYNHGRIVEINLLLENLSNKLFKLQLDINREIN